MAKKRKKKKEGPAHGPKKKVAEKKSRLPEALGWETFAALLIPSIIGAWFALRNVFEDDATIPERCAVAFVAGMIACALITWVANLLWRSVMRKK